MRRRQKNAFVTRNPGAMAGPRSSLAGMLSPLRASLKEAGFGHELTVSPMRLVDAVDIWPDLLPGPTASTLLAEIRPPAENAGGRGSSLAAISQRLGIQVTETFGDHAWVVDDAALRALAGLLQSRSLLAVVVDGPIEAGDARAMVEAARKGGSALDVEIRAVASVLTGPNHSLQMQARESLHAALLVAEDFRHYLAALRNQSSEEFTRPQDWQIQHVLSLTGALTVRPIETEVFSTSIDVGINTDPEGRPRPADRSLIYDIVSRTWHDEP